MEANICAPDIPDPVPAEETAAASTGTNIATALANTITGNYSQVTPESTTTFDQTGTYTFSDPFSGYTYDLPTYTQTTTYSPEQQAIYDQSNAAKLNLSTLAADQSAKLNTLLGTPMDTSSLPAWGSASSLYSPQYSQGYYGNAGLKNNFDSGGEITRSYGPEDGFSADRQRVEEALMGRLSPYLQQDKQALNSQLAAQGLVPGSEAYNRALAQLDAQQTDARLAVIGQAGEEQQRLNDMAAQQAGFKNAAQQQAYNQNLGKATFFNASQQQTLDNANQFTDRWNALEKQRQDSSLSLYNAQNTDRQNALNEAFALRQEPINEITALLSGSQVAAPSFTPASVASIPTTDSAGLINAEYDDQVAKAMADYKASQSIWGGALGGLGSLFSLSDERAKKDIEKVGETDDGMNLYAFRYKGAPKGSGKQVGLMAQEVKQQKPQAVRKRPDGLYEVNYNNALKNAA